MNTRSYFTNPLLTFDGYVNDMQQLIEATRTDLNNENRSRILQANLPQSFTPETKPTKGILLIHGLCDTPYHLQSLFDHFKQQNYLVRSLLLPGHGTVPSDLLDVRLEDWVAATRFAIESFQGDVEELYLAGVSTGAGLALHEALHHPFIRINHPYIFASNWHKLISWAYSPAEWVSNTIEKDYAKYLSFPFNAAHQAYRLSKHIKKINRSRKLSTPCFFVLSADDETIDSHAALDFFHRNANEHNQAIYYGNGEIHQKNVMQVPSAYPKQNIINFSHPCLAVAPDHPHYGEHSDYKDFRHYDSWWGKRFMKDDREMLFAGAINYENLHKHRLCRLQYNPHFSEMMQKIDAFLNTISDLDG